LKARGVALDDPDEQIDANTYLDAQRAAQRAEDADREVTDLDVDLGAADEPEARADDQVAELAADRRQDLDTRASGSSRSRSNSFALAYDGRLPGIAAITAAQTRAAPRPPRPTGLPPTSAWLSTKLCQLLL
jgi:hypothetical protein